jgi:hypothetical protein
MSTLKELIDESTDADVLATLVSAYDEDKNLPGYQRALDRLRLMEPQAKDKMRIVVSRVSPDEINPEPWWHVGGRDEADERWAIGFVPWAEWLAMPVAVENCDLTSAQMVAHCLWEMTFYGFEEEHVQEKKADLDRDCEELDYLVENIGVDEAIKRGLLHEWKPGDFEDD